MDLTANIIDVRDIIERIEELRDMQTPRFVAGFNMPGYMPDSEPVEFDDAEDAKRSIIESIKHAEECAESEELAESLSAFAEDVNLEGDEFSIQGPDGLIYWLKEDGIMGLDAEEAEELTNLESLMEDLQGMGGDEQWEGNWYPITLIRDSYFEEYAQELAEDCGMVPANAQWPNNCIDWEQAARELQHDYSSIDIGEVTYWTR